MHPCVETMMGLFGGPNLLNEGHFNPVPGMLLVEKRRRARTEMHERIGMQMQVNGNRPTIGRANPDNVQADEASFEVNVENLKTVESTLSQIRRRRARGTSGLWPSSP